jgi:predicted kinase
MIKTILVLRGLQGSGKSTFAKQWVVEKPLERIRFNRDDMRNMLGVYWVPQRESFIDNIYKYFLYSAMNKGYDIVIDNMNLNKKYIEEIKQYIELFNFNNSQIQYKIEIKTFDTPLEECIKRDSYRDYPIGEKVIRNTYDKYKDELEVFQLK